jgi:hypothetical protein
MMEESISSSGLILSLGVLFGAAIILLPPTVLWLRHRYQHKQPGHADHEQKELEYEAGKNDNDSHSISQQDGEGIVTLTTPDRLIASWQENEANETLNQTGGTCESSTPSPHSKIKDGSHRAPLSPPNLKDVTRTIDSELDQLVVEASSPNVQDLQHKSKSSTEQDEQIFDNIEDETSVVVLAVMEEQRRSRNTKRADRDNHRRNCALDSPYHIKGQGMHAVRDGAGGSSCLDQLDIVSASIGTDGDSSKASSSMQQDSASARGPESDNHGPQTRFKETNIKVTASLDEEQGMNNVALEKKKTTNCTSNKSDAVQLVPRCNAALWKQLLRAALPLLCSNLYVSLSECAILALISRYAGTDQLAAYAAALALLGIAVTPVVDAIQLTTAGLVARSSKRAMEHAYFGLLLSQVYNNLAVLIWCFLTCPLLVGFGFEKSIAVVAQNFIRTSYLSYWATACRSLLTGYLEAAPYHKASMTSEAEFVAQVEGFALMGKVSATIVTLCLMDSGIPGLGWGFALVDCLLLLCVVGRMIYKGLWFASCELNTMNVIKVRFGLYWIRAS